jgi:hypothetical protein
LKDPDEMNPDNMPMFKIGNQSVYGMEGDGGVQISPTKRDYVVLRKTKGVKIFSGIESAPWPDPSSISTILTTKHWPENYVMHYTPEVDWSDIISGGNRRELDNTVISCTMLYSFLTRDRFNSYWPDMNILLDRVNNEKLPIRETGFEDKHVFPEKDFDSKARKALGYFGEEGWPEDFVIISFSAIPGAISRESSGCGPDSTPPYSVQFNIEPRPLYLLVAEIEPRSEPVVIQQLGYMKDPQRMLRKRSNSTQRENSETGAQISLKTGNTVVIPLRIELRYDKDAYNKEMGQKTYQKIVKFPYESFKFTGVDTPSLYKTDKTAKIRTIFSKDKASFQQPTEVKISPLYIFGNSLELKDLMIDGKTVAVRPAPENAVAYQGQTGLGSCPFLYVDSQTSAEPVLVRRVLVGASSRDHAIDDEVKLQGDVTAMYLVEREPEITYVSEVTIWDEKAGKERLLLKDFTISPGEAKKIFIPPDMGTANVHIRGYYVTLGMLIAGKN